MGNPAYAIIVVIPRVVVVCEFQHLAAVGNIRQDRVQQIVGPVQRIGDQVEPWLDGDAKWRIHGQVDEETHQVREIGRAGGIAAQRANGEAR